MSEGMASLYRIGFWLMVVGALVTFILAIVELGEGSDAASDATSNSPIGISDVCSDNMQNNHRIRGD